MYTLKGMKQILRFASANITFYMYTLINLDTPIISRPLESQLKLEVEFHRVPYNQTFDFVTEQFVKILSLDCL